MAKCPNRNRKRRCPGGGTPGCQGELLAAYNLPIIVSPRRIPKGCESARDVLPRRVLPTLRQLRANAQACLRTASIEIYCPECGWSLSSLNNFKVAATRGRKR